jgi:hypothetical protein
MSQLIFGLPLNEPSKQTILPYITDSGRIYGFFPISLTTFQGTEQTFTVDAGARTVNLQTVTLPAMNSANTVLDNAQRVQQYMAAYFPISQEGIQPWRTFSSIVLPTPSKLRMYSWWSMPGATLVNHFSRGVFLNALEFAMNPSVPIPLPPVTPPVTTPQTLSWAATIQQQTLQSECSFIDFSWLELFQANVNANDPNNLQGNNILPIAVTSIVNPPGGYFKAVVLAGAMGSNQVAIPGGGVIYNTIRIIRLQDPPAGAYTFTFQISYTNGGVVQTTPATATLNLNVT